jgi:hypothetical protein
MDGGNVGDPDSVVSYVHEFLIAALAEFFVLSIPGFKQSDVLNLTPLGRICKFHE